MYRILYYLMLILLSFEMYSCKEEIPTTIADDILGTWYTQGNVYVINNHSYRSRNELEFSLENKYEKREMILSAPDSLVVGYAGLYQGEYLISNDTLYLSEMTYYCLDEQSEFTERSNLIDCGYDLANTKNKISIQNGELLIFPFCPMDLPHTSCLNIEKFQRIAL
ncbi:MAG: hypothetical protein JXR07_02225 [Reichenbachiella sp.]